MEVGLAADGVGVSSEVAGGLLAAGVGEVGHQAAGCRQVGEPRTPAGSNVTMVLRLREPLSCGCALVVSVFYCGRASTSSWF